MSENDTDLGICEACGAVGDCSSTGDIIEYEYVDAGGNVYDRNIWICGNCPPDIFDMWHRDFELHGAP